MGFFSRRSKREPSPIVDQKRGIDEFWSWWRTEGQRLAREGMAARRPELFADQLTSRLHALHPDLVWELGGDPARPQLVVGAGGLAGARATARRLQRRAPVDDGWLHLDSRPREEVAQVLEIGGARVDLADIVVRHEPDGSVLAVVAHHPAFATMPPDLRLQITMIGLDSMVGEDLVECWIGAIDASPIPLPPPTVSLGEFASVVDAHVAASTDEQGLPHWSLLQGTGPQGPVIVSAMAPLNPAIAPDLDQHVELALPYRDTSHQGLPGPDSLPALRSFEDHLSQRIGDSGMVVAHESSAGLRTLHFYVDSTTAAAAVLHDTAAAWNQGRADVRVELDPGWEAVGHLRT